MVEGAFYLVEASSEDEEDITMLTMTRAAASRWRLISVLMIAGLVVAACGSASKAATTAAAGSTPAVVTVMARSGPDGTYLTDGAGRALYLYTPDTTSTSTCTGGCAQIWPPLVTTATPTAGSGVTSSMLSTSKRSDGTTQVVYNGHPLYYFASDSAAGDIKGEGVMNIWWLVSPSGTAIEK